MPKDTRPAEERKETADHVTTRTELHITSMDCEYMDATATATWYTSVLPLIAEVPRRRPSGRKNRQTHARRRRSRLRSAPADGSSRRRKCAAHPAAASYPGSGCRRTPALLDPAAAGRLVDLHCRWSPAADGCRRARRDRQGPGWVVQLKGYHFHNTNAGLHLSRTTKARSSSKTPSSRHLEEGSDPVARRTERRSQSRLPMHEAGPPVLPW